ncbi:TetR family transcriptional regulator [Gordonia polyisoprenivorans]|uniref:TetR family transcriptional regulator n=1 Tax=Gordonia polyisoprenivorans TaxID=84595 RepID=UPI00036820A3|nr:TetR family transcriptional regulator [Gordonia polyisoprenivorans]
MGRWPDGSRERLMLAALDLFVERGFDKTSVADIAERAEVTERTFYRHFGDKREVLFDGGAGLRDAAMSALDSVTPDVGPLQAVGDALEAAATAFFTMERQPFSRRRQTVIDANPELQERELFKMATLTAALTAGLCDRGVDETTARLAAEMGITAFNSAFAQWIDEDDGRAMDVLIRAALDDVRTVARRLSS